MNLGIQQTSRMPPRQQRPGQSLHSGSRTLDSMTEAFGFDVSSFGDQAENLWTMLNNLHDSNPAEYDLFIQQQMKEVKKAHGQKTIIPEKGFVVKAFVVDKSGTRSSSKTQQIKIFVNFCHHRAVETPIDANGDKVTDKTETLANAKVPMIISHLRDMKDTSGNESHAIDVIFNPWCFKRCSCDSTFKYQMICLGLRSIMEEKKILIQPNWKLIRSTYKGGTGEEESDVHPFHVDAKLMKQKNDVGEDEQLGFSQESNCIMEDPTSLLQSLRRETCRQDDVFQLETAQKQNTSTSKKVLIQEINSNEDTKHKLMREVQPIKASKLEGEDESFSTKMRGFLNKKEKYKALYEKPSTGDGVKGTGGTYSNFMSKCQVIDTADLDKASKVPIIMKQEKKDFGNGIKRGFLKKNKVVTNEGCGDFDVEFDTIMTRADPNFARTFDGNCEDKLEKEFEEAMKGLASGMENNNGSKNPREALHVPIEPETDGYARSGTKTKIPVQILSTKQEFTVQLDLSETNISKIDDIIVEICGKELSVSTECGGQVKYIHPKIHDKVSAKFKRKTKLLSLIFSFNQYSCIPSNDI